MKRKFILPAAVSTLLLGAVILTGCAVATETTATTTAETVAASIDYTGAEAVLADNEDYTTTKADEWDATPTATVTLTGDSAEVDGDGVTVSGDTVTITAAGTYEISGDLDGQVVVAAPEDAVVAIILNGVDISSSTTAALAITSADDVAVSLVGDNTLTDGSSADADINAALYSEADLTITGDGSLTIDAANDGITSKDDLVVLSGDITVTAVDDGLRGKDALAIEGGTVTVTAGGDGLQSDQDDDATKGYIVVKGGSIDLTAGDDGMQASTDVVIMGGDTTITATDDGVKSETVVYIADGTVEVLDSYEGIESFAITIAGGEVTVSSSDDGVNATGTGVVTAASVDGTAETEATETTQGPGGMAGGGESDGGQTLTVTGGILNVAGGGDAIDSNGSYSQTGGTVYAAAATNGGDGAFDVNGAIDTSGGTFWELSTNGAPFASPDTGSFVAITGAASAGSTVQIVAADGTVLGEFVTTNALQSVMYASSALADGATYSLVVDGTSVGTGVEGTAVAGRQMGGGGQPGGGRR
jgi:hypothetical protein